MSDPSRGPHILQSGRPDVDLEQMNSDHDRSGRRQRTGFQVKGPQVKGKYESLHTMNATSTLWFSSMKSPPHMYIRIRLLSELPGLRQSVKYH
jgi:hypothetical protein